MGLGNGLQVNTELRLTSESPYEAVNIDSKAFVLENTSVKVEFTLHLSRSTL